MLAEAGLEKSECICEAGNFTEGNSKKRRPSLFTLSFIGACGACIRSSDLTRTLQPWKSRHCSGLSEYDIKHPLHNLISRAIGVIYGAKRAKTCICYHCKRQRILVELQLLNYLENKIILACFFVTNFLLFTSHFFTNP